jgi:alpha/beta superfamily hydrolase
MGEMLLSDAKDLVEPLLARGYRRLCIVGKSLGSPIAADLANLLSHDDITLILLTPIGDAVERVGRRRALVVIGTADPMFAMQQKFMSHAIDNVQWQVLMDVDHNLESTKGWYPSLAALRDVVEAVEDVMTA